MRSIQVGDVVRRTWGLFGNMRKGDVGKVAYVVGSVLRIENDPNSYDPQYYIIDEVYIIDKVLEKYGE